MWLYVPPECLPCAPEEAVWNSESDSLYQTLEQSVLWKSKPRQASSWKRGWKTDPLIRLLCGRIYEPSTAQRGAAQWISSLADTPASPSATPASASEQRTLDTCGPMSLESSTKSSPSGASSRTSALICDSDSVKSQEAFTAWATALRRFCLQRKKSALRTAASGSSFWPTATSSMATGAGTQGRDGGPNLQTAASNWPTARATDGTKSGQPREKTWDSLQPAATASTRNWQTPNAAAEAPNLGSNIKNGPKSLLAQAALTTESAGVCQTPATFQGRFRRQVSQTERAEELLPAQAESTTARVSPWATPTSRDWKDGASPSMEVATNGLLGRQAPRMMQDGALSLPSDQTSLPLSALTKNENSESPSRLLQRRLNPRFVEWLMGWSDRWTSLAPISSTSSETA